MIVTREFRFEAAHRLPHHGGKCKHLHGHSYRVEVQVEAVVDPSTGISVDFGDMKPLGKWIDDYLDHATLVWRGDSPLLSFLSDGGQKHFITDSPPTAETLALLLRAVASELIVGGSARFVRVWETVNCSALAGVVR
jgi:6-pyruvoyltetrahydropterin/6-carboxytetrahydropterin synthase